jgi:hypothetical protein
MGPTQHNTHNATTWWREGLAGLGPTAAGGSSGRSGPDFAGAGIHIPQGGSF